MQITKVTWVILDWSWKMDSKPVKMWGEWFWFDSLWVKACAPSKCAAWAIVYGPGLGGLSSQAEKLFRSGLIMVGPDWSNKTLRRGLVLRPHVDLVPVEFPTGSWHCWIWPWWISSHFMTSLNPQKTQSSKGNSLSAPWSTLQLLQLEQSSSAWCTQPIWHASSLDILDTKWELRPCGAVASKILLGMETSSWQLCWNNLWSSPMPFWFLPTMVQWNWNILGDGGSWKMKMGQLLLQTKSLFSQSPFNYCGTYSSMIASSTVGISKPSSGCSNEWHLSPRWSHSSGYTIMLSKCVIPRKACLQTKTFNKMKLSLLAANIV